MVLDSFWTLKQLGFLQEKHTIYLIIHLQHSYYIWVTALKFLLQLQLEIVFSLF